MNIVLYEPEIPPNTGNIIRLCANTGVDLHLIEPLGFSLDSKALRRAGLDYHETAKLHTYPNLDECLTRLQSGRPHTNIYAITTKGEIGYHETTYQPNDILLFGPESRGLPATVLTDNRVAGLIRIPMVPKSRSLNLANAVSVVTFEALRQLGFPQLV